MMGELILIILIIALIIVVCWPNLKWWYELYIKPSLTEVQNDEYFKKHPNTPPFCYECNELSCKGCKAHQAYLEDPKKGWDVWYNEMKYKGIFELDK
jgi:hypothetical protein